MGRGDENIRKGGERENKNERMKGGKKKIGGMKEEWRKKMNMGEEEEKERWLRKQKSGG